MLKCQKFAGENGKFFDTESEIPKFCRTFRKLMKLRTKFLNGTQNFTI